MILPNREKAHVSASKLYDYLLSTSHTVGKGKAKFFREFGFNESNISLLESGLLAIVQNEDVFAETTSPFGTKYTIDGTLRTPVGTQVNIRTVWIIETGEDEPRFVTAYPRPK